MLDVRLVNVSGELQAVANLTVYLDDNGDKSPLKTRL